MIEPATHEQTLSNEEGSSPHGPPRLQAAAIALMVSFILIIFVGLAEVAGRAWDERILAELFCSIAGFVAAIFVLWKGTRKQAKFAIILLLLHSIIPGYVVVYIVALFLALASQGNC
ncbi:MAG TPA: hypothetical protein VEJ63_11305 [Planctomycetota bacterium]|nr:hypothetical protein [Planctomycetota bacterium]